jgi:chromate transporter
MLLPGPEATQLATYIGWLLHGIPGGLVAGILFVLPGFFALLGLSALYAEYHQVAAVGAALFGLKAAVLAVVLEALLRIGRRVLKNGAMLAIAAGAFFALFAFALPFPLVVLAAGLVGLAGGRVRHDLFVVVRPPEAAAGTAIDEMLDAAVPEHARPSPGRALRTAVVWAVIWLLPVAALALVLGPDHVFSELAVFFSQAATVTFGGAYAVLAYVAQQAVDHYGWLRPAEMLDGLGMAETTPGPLILVLEFVGFQAGYRTPGALPPLLAGALGASITTWVTFAPCFLWIFLGAPYVEAIRGRTSLTAALSAITAAVVGVVLNLGVWFGWHLLVVDGRIDWLAAAISVAAGVALLRFHLGMIPVLAVSALTGLAAWGLGFG